MLFAFSRDRAVPGPSARGGTVSRHRVPVYAVLRGRRAVGFLLLLPTWWNNLAGYYVGTSVGTTCLYIAFILPVILRLRAGASFEHGAWSLGRKYRWINWVAIVWVAFISLLFILPITPAGHPLANISTWVSLNYAPIAVLGTLVLVGGWWLLSANKWFKGPIAQGSVEDLERIEAGYGERSAPAAGPGRPRIGGTRNQYGAPGSTGAPSEEGS